MALAPSAGATRAVQMLQEVAVAAINGDLTAVAALAVSHMTSLLDVDAGAIFAWNEAVQRLEPVHETVSTQREARARRGQGMVGQAFETGLPVLTHDYQVYQGRIASSAARGMRGAMCVPLFAEGRSIGCVGVWSYSVRHFSEDELSLLSLFATLVAPVLEATRSAEQARRTAHGFRSLYDVAVAAGGMTDPAELALLAVDSVRDLLASDGAALGLWDPASAKLKPYMRRDAVWVEGKDLILGEGAQGRSFELRAPMVVNDYAAWEGAMHPAVERGVKCIAAVPMLVGDLAVGSLAATRYRSIPFSQADVELLSLLASLIAPALEAARLEAASKESRRQLQVVLANSPLIAFAVDSDGAFSAVEGQGLELLGVLASDLIGTSIYKLGGGNPSLVAGIEQALAGHAGRIQVSSVMKGRSWDIILTPLRGSDAKICGASGIAIDITEHREAEAVKRESQAKSRFLAAMSHELRTPLNSVIGFAQLLQRQTVGHLNDRQLRYVEHISGSGQHLLSLINDVLDLTKILAGQVQVELVPLNLATTVTEALDPFHPQASSKSITVVNQVPVGLLVTADRRRLYQVLGNLVSNALKFTDGGGRVTLSARSLGSEVELSVTDTGIGIAADQQETIFREFVQGHSGTTRLHEGTGLGLPLSRELLDLMSGRLRVESEPGRGSIFTVTLPAAA